MAVLPMPCFCSFKSYYYNKICMAKSFATAATLTANPSTHPFHRISTRPRRTLGVDRVLIKEDDRRLMKKIMEIEDEGYLEREAAAADDDFIIIARLKMVVEGLREMEIQKFMNKVKGEASDSGIAVVEEMSREIISKFFEKPIQYLMSGGDDDDGCFQQKLKDVEVLLRILENSCPVNQILKSSFTD